MEPAVPTRTRAALAAVLSAVLLGYASLGCASPQRASFEIVFARPALGERAVRVEITVHEGSCRGPVLHEDAFDARGQGAPIAPLPPGSYGFRARISDASCVTYAEGCSQVSLPETSGRVVVVVADRDPEPLCDPASCSAGWCGDGPAPPRDAGAPARDAEIALDGAVAELGDAGELEDPEVALDAGVPSVDAGTTPPELVPTNVPGPLVAIGVADLVVRASDAVVVLDTDDGSLERLSDGADRRPAGVAMAVLPQLGGAPDLAVLSLRTLRIEAGAELRVVGSAALVLAVRDEVLIEGRIDADGDDRTPGPGGFAGGAAGARAGRGPGGGRAGPSDVDVGGGGGGHFAAGGAGGDSAGSRGGAGGVSCGTADLSPLVGGSGGASGGGSTAPGEGGGGGGAVQIVSDRIVIASTGVIDCAGAGGRGGGEDDGGGGGGAGGAILLEALELEVHGAVVANGGGGGAGADVSRRGANGEPGQVSERAARGGAATGEATRGGDGGASASSAGDDGADATGSLDNAGGGGGAGGRIRLRAASMSVEGAVLSPRAAAVLTGL